VSFLDGADSLKQTGYVVVHFNPKTKQWRRVRDGYIYSKAEAIGVRDGMRKRYPGARVEIEEVR
jgi:hypothetical protein